MSDDNDTTDPIDFTPNWRELLARTITEAWLAGVDLTTFMAEVNRRSEQLSDPQGYRDLLQRLCRPIIIGKDKP